MTHDEGFVRLVTNLRETCGNADIDASLQSIIPILMLAMLAAGLLLYRAARVVATALSEWPARYVSHGLRGGALFCYWSFAVSFGAFISPCIFVASGRYHVGLWYWLGLFTAFAFYGHWVTRDVRAGFKYQQDRATPCS